MIYKAVLNSNNQYSILFNTNNSPLNPGRMRALIMKNEHYLERARHAWSSDSVRLIATASQFAKATYFYMQECGYFKTYYPYFTERQGLNSFLIIYTLSGRGILRYEENQYPLNKGQCFFINCMKHHYYETLKNSNWEFLWVHFNGTSALGYYEEFARTGFKILNIDDQPLIESTLRKIIAVNQKKDAKTEIITANLIVNLLSGLLIQGSLNETNLSYMPDYIKTVMQYIDKNYNSPIQLEDLSKLVLISKFYLSKQFKRYVGTTIGEYIINTRLSYAKELLKYSEFTISEICYRCGFNNVSHFINLFKDREETTPLAYRHEWVMH